MERFAELQDIGRASLGNAEFLDRILDNLSMIGTTLLAQHRGDAEDQRWEH